MLLVSWPLAQDLCDYFPFKATREPFKSSLVSRLLLLEFFSFYLLSVQLNGLKTENTIWASSSTQHTQSLSISILGNKNVTKQTPTKQPHFRFSA